MILCGNPQAQYRAYQKEIDLALHLFVMRCSQQRDELQAFLKQKGVGCN